MWSTIAMFVIFNRSHLHSQQWQCLSCSTGILHTAKNDSVLLYRNSSLSQQWHCRVAQKPFSQLEMTESCSLETFHTLIHSALFVLSACEVTSVLHLALSAAALGLSPWSIFCSSDLPWQSASTSLSVTLFLFCCGDVLGRELGSIWHVDLAKLSPVPLMDCLCSAAHLSPVSQVFIGDCIWPKSHDTVGINICHAAQKPFIQSAVTVIFFINGSLSYSQQWAF